MRYAYFINMHFSSSCYSSIRLHGWLSTIKLLQ
jgi:hypothetical protein